MAVCCRSRYAARLSVLAFAGALASGCGDAGELSDAARDGGFGRGVTQYPRDAGMDGGADSPASGDLGSLRVRFLHALVNLGPLHVCHDADGPGPAAPAPLLGEGKLLTADFRARSASLVVPALAGGTLTLQHTPGDAGVSGDGGLAVPCDDATREATIPLPVSGDWLDPRAPLDDGSLEALGLEKTLAGGSALTLLGSGLALSPAALEARATQARDRALAGSPTDTVGASRAAELELRSLEAAYGARVLIHRDPPTASAKTFGLAVLHASPDVASSDASEGVGAVRLCITAGTRESSVVPKAPEPGIAYRYRASVGSSFDPGLEYHFRIFAERDFDAEKKDCSTISVSPLAERRVTRTELRAGHTYTLALLGALAPSAVCSPASGSLVRAGCAHPAAELGAQLALLED
ncbi:MAG: hypothetical protein ABW252_06275 [Polyangiales bacterium]